MTGRLFIYSYVSERFPYCSRCLQNTVRETAPTTKETETVTLASSLDVGLNPKIIPVYISPILLVHQV